MLQGKECTGSSYEACDLRAGLHLPHNVAQPRRVVVVAPHRLLQGPLHPLSHGAPPSLGAAAAAGPPARRFPAAVESARRWGRGAQRTPDFEGWSRPARRGGRLAAPAQHVTRAPSAIAVAILSNPVSASIISTANEVCPRTRHTGK